MSRFSTNTNRDHVAITPGNCLSFMSKPETRASRLEPRSLIPTGWRETWRPAEVGALGLTQEKPGQGRTGYAYFIAGTYPACSEHGAMNKVNADTEVWRCLNCNIGGDYTSTRTSAERSSPASSASKDRPSGVPE